MRTRHRPFYRLNSMVSLGILVLLGVVVTTVVQAEGRVLHRSGATDMAWIAGGYGIHTDGSAVEQSAVGSAGNTWLLPSRVRMSFRDGMYHLRLQGSGDGDATGADKGQPGKLSLMLSVGYGEEDRTQAFANPDDDAMAFERNDQYHRSGPLFFMSVGSRW